MILQMDHYSYIFMLQVFHDLDLSKGPFAITQVVGDAAYFFDCNGLGSRIQGINSCTSYRERRQALDKQKV
jgi:hypothetical protein